MYKKIKKYLSAYPMYNGVIHILVGAGIGILITYPFVGDHPVRWGTALLALGLAGHLYPLLVKK